MGDVSAEEVLRFVLPAVSLGRFFCKTALKLRVPKSVLSTSAFEHLVYIFRGFEFELFIL